MIYLIGGAPRIGKSIIARELANKIDAKFVSTDDLEMPKGGLTWPSFSDNPLENTTTPSERVNLQIEISKALEPTIENLITKASYEQKNVVIEGIHLLPSHVVQYIQKYSAKAIFIGWKDAMAVLAGMAQNDNPNDWLKDANEDVRRQVVGFTVAFSEYIEPEAKKYGLSYIERTENFVEDVKHVISMLI